MKRLFALCFLFPAMMFGQAIRNVPTPSAMYISSDGTGNVGTWVPEPGSGTSALPSVPSNSVGAYCSNDGSGNAGTWVPCGSFSAATGFLKFIFWGQIAGTGSADPTPVLPNAFTVVGATLSLSQAPVGCTTFPVVHLWDFTAGSSLANVTLAAATVNYTLTITTAAATVGHQLALRINTAPVGCSTNAQNATLNVFYH